MLHVFSGTKAQYIKMAPLLALLDAEELPYRLLDSGQHAGLAPALRRELGIREPDHRLGGEGDVASIGAGLWWALGLAWLALWPERLRREVFGAQGGVCVVHGDTTSTLLAAVLARRAGLRVAHMEAGLRSHSLLHPFPEELIRVLVMRMAHVLYAPDAAALTNLRRMRVRGRVVATGANTMVDALRRALGDELPEPASGPVVLSLHRLENLQRRGRLRGFVDLAIRVRREQRVRFVLHPPTRRVLERRGWLAPLEAAGVEVTGLVPHTEFTRLIAAAPFVVTDGGSIQEEAAALGVPCLLWRGRTERPDGVGSTTVLARYDDRVVSAFLADPAAHRGTADGRRATPSARILADLVAMDGQ